MEITKEDVKRYANNMQNAIERAFDVDDIDYDEFLDATEKLEFTHKYKKHLVTFTIKEMGKK